MGFCEDGDGGDGGGCGGKAEKRAAGNTGEVGSVNRHGLLLERCGDTRTQQKSRLPWLNVAPAKGEDKNNQGSVGSVYCQYKYGLCTLALTCRQTAAFVKAGRIFL
jgi:hypothetical protein